MAPADRAIAPPIVVLESHVGPRPSRLDAVLAPLLDELDRRGFTTRPASVLARIAGRGPLPGALDPGITAAEVAQSAESGYEAYTRGRFAEAEAALGRALERIHRNPALLVLDTHNLEATFKILVALALSQARRGDAGGSAATLTELIRTFRNQPISRIDYGPDAEQFYRAVARHVQTLGRGQLSIDVDSDQAMIFVDGQIRGIGRANLAELVPGTYRVFVQVPAMAGRQYEVEVTAGHHSVLRVDWDLDSSLWLTERWVGFAFASEAERAKQARFAGALARRWELGELLAVIGTAQVAGQPAIVAQLYDASGRVVRSAAVVLDGADESRLRSLARFLSDGVVGDGVRVVHSAARAAGDRAPVARPGAAVSVGLWRWGAQSGSASPRFAIGRSSGLIVRGGVL